MIFSYKARDASGSVRSGTLEAGSLGDLATKLAGRGLTALEAQPLSGSPTAAAAPAPSSGGSGGALANVNWPKAIGGVLAMVVLLLGLGYLPKLFRSSKTIEVKIMGLVEASGDAVFNRKNTRLYVYFPQIHRTVRADGQQFELIGGRLVPGQLANWRPYTDPNGRYDVTWNGNQYEVKVTLSVSEMPKSCRVTVFKTGFTRGRTSEFNLEEDGALKLKGSAPGVMLSPRAGSPISPGTGHMPGGSDGPPSEGGQGMGEQ